MMIFRKNKKLLMLLCLIITVYKVSMLKKNTYNHPQLIDSPTAGTFTVRNIETTPELSIIAACMDRNDYVLRSVKSWLNALAKTNISVEIVLVDWSSKTSIQKTLAENNVFDPRIIHVQVKGQTKWILSVAYNIGAKIASSKKNLLKLDCDTVTDSNFFVEHKLQPESFYAGNFRIAETENEMHLNGVTMLPVAAFLKVGGYDERIQTYGFDDDNLYERLVQNGYKRNDFLSMTLRHIQHDDSERLTNQPDSQEEIDLENYLNRATSSMLPKWTFLDQKATYDSRKVTDNHHIISNVRFPQSLRQIIKKGDIDYIKIQYFIKKLKKLGLPKSILNNHGDYKLYRNLSRTYSKGPMIMIDVKHGLGNRLRALASAAVIASKSGRHLRIIWRSDIHCNASFYDLFDSSMNFDVYDSMDMKELSTPNVVKYNYMEPEKGAVKYEEIKNQTSKHIYVKSAYVLSSKWVKESLMRDFLQNLVPSEPVRKIINSFSNVSSCIGVHVRNQSPVDELKLKKDEYPVEGWNDLIKYRKACTAEAFIRKMKEISDKDPKACFFVSADSEESKDAIQSEFRTGQIWMIKGSCSDRTAKCLQEALAELLILGKTKEILGSFWSSFSEVAGLMIGKRPSYAGKDFI